jgi:glyoxalase family protein
MLSILIAMQLTGFHHLTAVTADAPRNHAFYTQTLGLRLVKKSVNQDDVSAYHLFYADGLASPGTDITFFDWPVGRERRGSHSVVRTGLRVDGAESLAWWAKRFANLPRPGGRPRRASDPRLRGFRGAEAFPGRR